jgi:very-short-patch-repair endonuclease
MRTPDHVIADTARHQHGVFGRRQAIAAGFTPAMITHRLRCGRWIEVAPQVYLVNGAPDTPKMRLIAECLSARGIASHRSAAALRGVDGYPLDAEPEITIEAGTWVARSGVRVHESLDVHRTPTVFIDNIPTTTAPRLAIDLGGVVSFLRYSRAMDDLLIRRQVTWEELLDCLHAFAKRGRNGSAALRAYLREHYGEAITESMLEQTFLRGFGLRGLIEPTPQVEVHDERGFIARVDFAHIDAMVLMELDGRRHHGRSEAFELDPEKRNRLTTAGWRVLVYTWRRVIDRPNGVYAEVEQARLAGLASPHVQQPIITIAGRPVSRNPAA